MSDKKAEVMAVNSHDQFIKAVQTRVSDLQKSKSIKFPPNYSPDNSLISAGLMIQGVKDRNGKSALEVCTKESITGALVNMVVQGLSVAKNQGYFIVYGNKLTFMRSYFGTIASAKRVCPDIVEVNAVVVYVGDTFTPEMVNGRFVIDQGSHKTSFKNMDNDFIGAYCIVEMKGDIQDYVEVMTKKMIKTAWSKGMAGSKLQKEFPDQAVKRTIINRACKNAINTSDDSNLDVAVQAFNATGGSIFEPQITDGGNKKQIETHHGKVEMEVEVEPEEKPNENWKKNFPIDRDETRQTAKEQEPIKQKPEKVIEREEPKPEVEEIKSPVVDDTVAILLTKLDTEAKAGRLSEGTLKILSADLEKAKGFDEYSLIDGKCRLCAYVSLLVDDRKISTIDVSGWIEKILKCENPGSLSMIQSNLQNLK